MAVLCLLNIECWVQSSCCPAKPSLLPHRQAPSSQVRRCLLPFLPARPVLSSGGRRAYCSLVQCAEPRWWPKAWQWEELIVLDLAPGPASTQLIAAQQGYISFGSLLSPLALLGWAYSSLLRRAAGLSISAAVQLSGCTYRWALAGYKGAVFAAGGTDAGPPPGKSAQKGRRRRVAVQALAG